jgi:tetratricopeptide (TPR) repeat protein
MFLTLGRTDDALAQYEDSLAISLALAEADPQHVEKQSDLIYIYYKIAQAETNRDRFETAEKNLRSAILIYDQMIANKQNLPTANQGKTFMEGQLQAMQSLRLALGDWETVLQSPVDDLPGLLDYRAIQCCQRKRFVEAEQAAEKLCELAQATDGNLYNAACVYALCAMAIASPEDSELAADDKSRKEILLAKSVGALQKAVEKGWTDFDHMRQDSDLAPLRELPEFKALVPADQ